MRETANSKSCSTNEFRYLHIFYWLNICSTQQFERAKLSFCRGCDLKNQMRRLLKPALSWPKEIRIVDFVRGIFNDWLVTSQLCYNCWKGFSVRNWDQASGLGKNVSGVVGHIGSLLATLNSLSIGCQTNGSRYVRAVIASNTVKLTVQLHLM